MTASSSSCCPPIDSCCGIPSKSAKCAALSNEAKKNTTCAPSRQSSVIIPTKEGWYRHSNNNMQDQFEDYDETTAGLPVNPKEEKDADPWTYSGDTLQALQFPLGGFGTGQILFQGDGTLQGWTILNNFHNQEYTPLHKLPGYLFGIQATVNNTPNTQSFVLQTPQNYTVSNCQKHHREESHVTASQIHRLQHLPGIRSLTARCQYPIATIDYDIPGFLVEVKLETLTPLIPNNTRDSSLPLAVFTFRLTNPSPDQTVTVSMLQTALNFVGWDGTALIDPKDPKTASDFWKSNVNTPLLGPGYQGWSMTSQNDNMEATRQGSLALVAMTNTNNAQTGLLVSDGMAEEKLWHDFCGGKSQDPTAAQSTTPSAKGRTYIGGVTQTVAVPPKSTQICQFALVWHFPNRPSYSDRPQLPSILGNQYQVWFPNGAAEVLSKGFAPRANHLLDMTRRYVELLYATTIPFELLESAAGRVSVLRSPSLFWTKDGIILGNEGNNCCPLNCTHVYGYTMLMERLYPDIAKNMLVSNFVGNFDQDKGCSMRFGAGGFAIDGSLACVIKTYLVVKQADSDLSFLRLVWPNVKRQIEIILEQFADPDDCVIRCLQQNTYDTAMNGANTFIGSYWITALRATSTMARLMNDNDFSELCSTLSLTAMEAYDRICWNDEFQYYIADVDASNAAHSYGMGCFIDQLSACGLSLAASLGPVLRPEREAAARSSIFQHNRVAKPPFQDFQKHFYDGDQGIRVNTYPHGKIPGCYVYDDLVSTGFSYPVIAGMIHDGGENRKKALDWARMIRNRHSGRNRSPWNEPECGLLYVRAMAGWNLFDQSCGFQYDAITGSLRYEPKFLEDSGSFFKCFLVVEDGWGQFIWNDGVPSSSSYYYGDESNRKHRKITIECHYGSIVLSSIAVNQLKSSCGNGSINSAGGATAEVIANIGSKSVDATFRLSEGKVELKQKTTIPAGSSLSIVLWSEWTDTASEKDTKSPNNNTTTLVDGFPRRMTLVGLICAMGLLWWIRGILTFHFVHSEP